MVTSFLTHRGRILVLRRSQQVATHQGRWAGVSGYLEETATPRQQALREIEEETGLAPWDVRLLAEGQPLEAEDPQYDTRWRVFPFLWQVLDLTKLRTDWEHVESRWVRPEELAKLETVPRLRETWQRVAPKSAAA